MYDELYDAWRLEIDNQELSILPADFYIRLVGYMRNIKDENMLLDKAKGVRANLLAKEMSNANQMTQDLVSIRCRKIAKLMVTGHEIPFEHLAVEEQAMCRGVGSFGDAFKRFKDGILGGQLVKIHVSSPIESATEEAPVIHKRVTLRFLKPVPSIIGGDMKSYGPFLVEDVASVPLENARILIKQGLAKAVEIQ